MDARTVFDVACYGIGLLGGLILGVAPFGPRGRMAPHWIRVALWLGGPMAVAWGILGFILLFGSATLSEHAYAFIRHVKTLICGMAVGIFVLLFASGQFIRAFSRSATASDT